MKTLLSVVFLVSMVYVNNAPVSAADGTAKGEAMSPASQVAEKETSPKKKSGAEMDREGADQSGDIGKKGTKGSSTGQRGSKRGSSTSGAKSGSGSFETGGGMGGTGTASSGGGK